MYCGLIRRRALSLIALALATVFSSAGFAATPQVTVFQNGQDGYPVFRIPAMVVAANGDLLVFCEARQGGDASEIDLVMKRSTDEGKTWGPLRIVKANETFSDLYPDSKKDITIGNPAPLVDHLDPKHKGRIWLPFTLENDRVFVTYSDDHGRSWAKHQEITSKVKRDGWGWYATGPGHSIQLLRGKHRGRLVIPCDHRLGEGGRDRGDLAAHALISDDHGLSWKLGAVDETYHDGLNANETTVVELNDGRLLFNTRDQNGSAKGTRGEAVSSDGGETFDRWEGDYSVFRPTDPTLDPPVVQCTLLRAASRTDGDELNLILFSGPDSDGPNGQGRSDLRIRYSTDEGKSWNDGPLVHVGAAAYSDMVRLANHRYGVLFEAGDGKRYDRIVFTVIDQASLQLHQSQ